MIVQTPGQKKTAKARKVRSERGHYRVRESTGVVTAEESFTMAAFCARIGATASQVIEMRRRGLIVRQDGGRLKVLGSDYIAYLAQLPVAGIKGSSVASTQPSP